MQEGKTPTKIVSSVINPDREKNWAVAERCAQILGPVPTEIKFAVSSLMNNYLQNIKHNTNEISPGSYAAVKLIDKTVSLKSSLYFGALALYPKRFGQAEDDTSKALLNILGPGLFGALLMCAYLIRRAGKLIKEKENSEITLEKLLAATEIGYRIGASVSKIGEADGAVLGLLPYISLASLYLADEDAFLKLQAKPNALFDPIEHRRLFSCDYAQIGAHILKMFAYTKHPLVTLRDALLGNLDADYRAFGNLQIWAYANDLLNRIRKRKTVSFDCSLLDITDTELKAIANMAKIIKKKGSTFGWICRGNGFHASPKNKKANKNGETEKELKELQDLGFNAADLKYMGVEDLKELKRLIQLFTNS